MEKEAHCLILPYPIQGHINPMIQFSKRLAAKGMRITIAALRNLVSSSTLDFPGSSISVEPIAIDSLEWESGASIQKNRERLRQVGPETVSDLLQKLKNKGSPVHCIIYDPFLTWALAVAKKFGLLGAIFFTQSSSVNLLYYNVHDKHLEVPLDPEKEISDGGWPPLEISDLPSFLRDPHAHPGALEFLLDQFQNIEDADFVLVNSFYELEPEATDWLRKYLPVKTIGPTVPSIYLDQRLTEDKNYGLSLFKADDSCMQWLDKRPASSVIYTSFGSMARLQEEQMEELALALKMSNHHFLWVVRSSEESKLPLDFLRETSEKGLVVSWCPQLEVLAHKAVCCFLTHCGWNSTLEALSLGVPLVAMPWWSDQPTNSKFVMDVWKTGVRARPDEKNVVTKEEIGRCVKDIMEGVKGEEMRENAWKWKELAKRAVDEGGSSDKNIQEFIHAINQGDMPVAH